jgi:hypothetical protein
MIITLSVKDIIGFGIIGLMVVALLILYAYYCIDEWRNKRKKKK